MLSDIHHNSIANTTAAAASVNATHQKDKSKKKKKSKSGKKKEKQRPQGQLRQQNRQTRLRSKYNSYVNDLNSRHKSHEIVPFEFWLQQRGKIKQSHRSSSSSSSDSSSSDSSDGGKYLHGGYGGGSTGGHAYGGGGKTDNFASATATATPVAHAAYPTPLAPPAVAMGYAYGAPSSLPLTTAPPSYNYQVGNHSYVGYARYTTARIIF